MTAQELASRYRGTDPNSRFATNRKQNAVGKFSSEHGRFVEIAVLGIDGKWYRASRPILCNGQPVFSAESWIE